MSKPIAVAIFAGALLIGAQTASALQCVPYARDASGVSLRGDAWTWWSAAAGQYERGQAPRPGAVVVFKKHGSMRYGHVAVVKSVVNSREVLVDHANWGSRRTGGRGRVAKNVAVVDVSARNDWSQVRVWNTASDDYGSRTYPTYGFIYPNSPRASHVQMASAAVNPATATASRMLADAVMSSVDVSVLNLSSAAKPVSKAEPKTEKVEAKAEPKAEVKIDTKVEAKIEIKPEIKVEARLEPKAEPAKPVKVAAAPVATPAPAPAAVAEAPAAAAVEQAWEGDAALARRFGAGRYSSKP